MDCGSRIQGPHNPVAPSTLRTSGCPSENQEAARTRRNRVVLGPYTRHFSTLHRTRMQTELERRTHTEQKRKTFPATNSQFTPAQSCGPCWGLDRRVALLLSIGCAWARHLASGASFPVGETGTSGRKGHAVRTAGSGR